MNRDYASFLGAKRPLSLQINDLSALFCGAKSVVYTSIKNAEDEKMIKELCEAFRFDIRELRKFRDIAGNETMDILIGKDRKKMEKAASAYLNGRPHEWGVWLDYPQCCVEFYGKWEKEKKESLVKKIAEASRKNRFFDFRMNNVLNFYSRISSEKLRNEHKKFLEINAHLFRLGLDFEPVLPWHPCSYNCRKSLEAAETIFDFMEKQIPQTAEKRKRLLSLPVIFKDDFEWFVLKGKSVKNAAGFFVKADGIAPPLSLADKKYFEKAARLSASKDLAFFKKEGYILLPFN